MTQRYCTNFDYQPIIQPGQIEYQLLSNDIQTVIQAENIAIAEAQSLLAGKYDLSSEFTATNVWSYGASYSPGMRVIMDYATYSSGVTYSLGQCVIVPNINVYDNSNYNPIGEAYCLTGTVSWGPTTSLPSNDSNWSDLGEQFSFYNVNYPAPYFNQSEFYQVGDIVYWDGFTWSCQTQTPAINQTLAEQYIYINAIPRNPLPTGPENSAGLYWLTASGSCQTPLVGETYSIGTQSIGTYTIYDTLPTNTNFWSAGDNRSQMMLLRIMEIALYYLHKRIQPTNIPEHRMVAYRSAMKYFEDLIEGRKNTPIQIIQPSTGNTIRFGGNVRKTRLW